MELRLSNMKKTCLILVSVIFSLVLSCNVASAQSLETPAPEHKLRPDVLKILCQDFPLNSRCQGASSNSSTSNTKPSDTKKNPDNNTPGTAPIDTGTPGIRRGAPPDSAPLSPTPGGVTPDHNSPG